LEKLGFAALSKNILLIRGNYSDGLSIVGLHQTKKLFPIRHHLFCRRHESENREIKEAGIKDLLKQGPSNIVLNTPKNSTSISSN